MFNPCWKSRALSGAFMEGLNMLEYFYPVRPHFGRQGQKGELSMPKILLETEFEDSTLEKEMFRVKITRYSSDVVYGDAVEVEIRHPEEDFIEVYDPAEFPEQFYSDLDFRGWSFVAEEIKERL